MRILLLALGMLLSVTAYAQYPLSISPSRVAFATTPLNSTDTVIVMVRNQTAYPITELQMEMKGPDTGSFFLDGTLGELESGDSMVLVAVFAPQKAGAHEAYVEFLGKHGNTVGGPLGICYLAGNGAGSGLFPTHQSVVFDWVTVGESASKTFTLTNYNATDLTVGLTSLGTTAGTFVDFQSAHFALLDQNGEDQPRTITIGAGNTVTVTVVFTPTEAAISLDTIHLQWEGQVTNIVLYGVGTTTDRVTIKWAESFADTNNIFDAPGDFIADSVGGEAVWIVRMENNTADTQVVIVAQSLVAMPSYFTVAGLNSAHRVSLEPGSYVDLDVVYTGHGPDPFTDSLIFLDDSGTTLSGALLVGYIRPPGVVRLWLSSLSGKPGETEELKIVAATAIPDVAAQARLTLSFNASVLSPQFPTSSDETANGVRTVVTTVSVPSHTIGTQLASLPFMIAMGDQTVSEVTLPNVEWLSETGTVLPIETESGDATSTVEDGRTVNPNAGSIVMTLTSSPANSNLAVEFRGTEGIATIDVFDLQGVRLFTDQVPTPTGTGTFSVNLSSFARGMYVVRVSDRSHSLARRFMIE